MRCSGGAMRCSQGGGSQFDLSLDLSLSPNLSLNLSLSLSLNLSPNLSLPNSI